MKTLSWLLLFIVPVIAGCAPTTWVRVSKPEIVAPDQSFSIDLPVGWVLSTSQKDAIFVTKDGAFIQYIEASRVDHENALKNIKKSTSAALLPTELADLVIANLSQQIQVGNASLLVVSNEPASIAGHQGFRLHCQIKTTEGLRIERVSYGFVTQQGFFLLTYNAPTLHYFERDLPAFEQSVRSMRLLTST